MTKKTLSKLENETYVLLSRNLKNKQKRPIHSIEKLQLLDLARIINHEEQAIITHELVNYYIIREALGTPKVELGMTFLFSGKEYWAGIFQFKESMLFVYLAFNENIQKVEIIKLGDGMGAIPLLINSRPKDLFWTTFELLFEEGLWL
ncbi:hypothetical protein IFO69_01065 [Echinicola sp. CAU 1574]|uniref:Uncharacterized protein n=1 Tax=Echinicola arenosa TaxID=2774144 RepID=A0ABR9AF66_9BACT|nr:hypothetical protein [Echinicola arenosa]MBD8487327.1 hypothetical protein [Echinicola arenosa]